MHICVFGASSDLIDESYIHAVEQLGEQMAQRGHGLVYGGSAHGLMGAIARGAHKAGGDILGVAPQFFDVDGKNYENCTELVYTATMRERKRVMDERSDAVLMVPGGIGTFDEFFEILTLKQLARHNKPIAIYNVNGYFDDMMQMLETAVKQQFMPAANLELFRCFQNPAELLDYLEGYAEKSAGVLKHI